MYLLDTNACIRLLNGTSPALVARLRQESPADIALCSIVKAELLFGAHRSARPAENLRRLETFFAPLASLGFDDVAASRYGELRAGLVARGESIGPNDLLIAAIAVAQRCTLVTHDVREFGRVPGLAWVDWEG